MTKFFDDAKMPKPIEQGKEPSSLDLAFQSQHTITPSSVFQQIREDVIMVLGLRPNISNRFTALEEELIDAIERVLRKGQCPSILVQTKPLFEAMLSLKKYFTRDKVTVYLERGDGNQEQSTLIMFSALYQYARDAAFCAQKIRELNHQANKTSDPGRRQLLKNKAESLRLRRNKDMLNFQKIIFTDAEKQRVSSRRRGLQVHDQWVTLDQLIKYFKTGRKPEPETGKMPLAPKSPEEAMKHMAPASSKPDPPSEDTEVLDWRQIRSKKKDGQDANRKPAKKYDFRL